MGHRPAGSQASDDASARAGGRYRVDVSGRVRSPGPSCSSRQPASTFHHAVSARTTHGRLGSPLDSALGPGLHVFSSPRTGRSWIHSRHEGGTRRGGNAESHNSASSRQQQAYRRSTAWPQAGLRRRTASPPWRPARALGGDPRQGRRTVRDASRTSDQDRPRTRAPQRGRRARSERRPMGPLGGARGAERRASRRRGPSRVGSGVLDSGSRVEHVGSQRTGPCEGSSRWANRRMQRQRRRQGSQEERTRSGPRLPGSLPLKRSATSPQQPRRKRSAAEQSYKRGSVCLCKHLPHPYLRTLQTPIKAEPRDGRSPLLASQEVRSPVPAGGYRVDLSERPNLVSAGSPNGVRTRVSPLRG
jgi:hypothetical protein